MPTPDHGALIDRQPELDAACARMSALAVLPVDTEFVRTDTYRPRLCLIQIGLAQQVCCADMLAPLDFTGLWAGIANPAALKIMHAAKQDMEALLLRFGGLPGPVFDTQIAAGLLGHPPQAGYATLVDAELGVRLDKSQTRTDWARRPLTTAQIDYAANDVVHLPELCQRLRNRLKDLGREAWALEDSAALLDEAQYGVRPDNAWERLTGIAYQPVAVQARARRLAAWREQRADQADRPRQWILSDQALTALASAGPADLVDLSGIQALDVMPAGAVRKSGEALLAEMRQADADLASGGLNLTQQARPGLPDNTHMKRLGAVVQEIATKLGVAPEILATRSDMTAMLRGAKDLRPLRGWRRMIIGEALLAAL